jgi:hypothetical protein
VYRKNGVIFARTSRFLPANRRHNANVPVAAIGGIFK